MNETTEARLARRFAELTAKTFTGEAWAKAQVLWNSGTLSKNDKQKLAEIVINRDYTAMLLFSENCVPATPVFKGWKNFKRMTLKSLRGMWEFFAGVIMVILVALAGFFRLVYRKMLVPTVKSVCYVIRKCSGWLIGLFCLGLGFCWWVVTSSLAYVLSTLYACFGFLCRLFAGDPSVITEAFSEQCKANHTTSGPGSGNTTGNNQTENPTCCEQEPKFEFLKYWDETPVARQMVMNHFMHDVQNVKSSFRNVLSDMVARGIAERAASDLAEQKKLLENLKTELEANRAKTVKQGTMLDTIFLVITVYVAAKSVAAGRDLFLAVPGARDLRAAAALERARVLAAATLGNAPEVAREVTSWMSWDTVRTVVGVATKYAPLLSTIPLGLYNDYIFGPNPANLTKKTV